MNRGRDVDEFLWCIAAAPRPRRRGSVRGYASSRRYDQSFDHLKDVPADQRPSNGNVQTLHHNRAKSCMALGRHLPARKALEEAVRLAGGATAYPAAADKLAECESALLEHTKAAALWDALAKTGLADDAKKSSWRQKAARERTLAKRTPRDMLGIDARASAADVKKAYRKKSMQSGTARPNGSRRDAAAATRRRASCARDGA